MSSPTDSKKEKPSAKDYALTTLLMAVYLANGSTEPKTETEPAEDKSLKKLLEFSPKQKNHQFYQDLKGPKHKIHQNQGLQRSHRGRK